MTNSINIRLENQDLQLGRNGCSGRAESGVCKTNWFRADNSGIFSRGPEVAPCPDELSQYVLSGAETLDSIYCSAPFEVVVPDVPSNELGLVGQFRNLCGLKLGASDETLTTQVLAATNTIQKATAVIYPIVGILISVATEISATSAPQNIQIVTSDILAASNLSPANRSISIKLKKAAATFDIFVPIAMPNNGTNTWAPVLGIVDNAGPSEVAITGAGGVGAGNITVRWVGPSSQALEAIIAAMANAGAL